MVRNANCRLGGALRCFCTTLLLCSKLHNPGSNSYSYNGRRCTLWKLCSSRADGWKLPCPTTCSCPASAYVPRVSLATASARWSSRCSFPASIPGVITQRRYQNSSKPTLRSLDSTGGVHTRVSLNKMSRCVHIEDCMNALSFPSLSVLPGSSQCCFCGRRLTMLQILRGSDFPRPRLLSIGKIAYYVSIPL